MIALAFIKKKMEKENTHPWLTTLLLKVYCQFLIFHGGDYEVWVPHQVIICILPVPKKSLNNTLQLCGFYSIILPACAVFRCPRQL